MYTSVENAAKMVIPLRPLTLGIPHARVVVVLAVMLEPLETVFEDRLAAE